LHKINEVAEREIRIIDVQSPGRVRNRGEKGAVVDRRHHEHVGSVAFHAAGAVLIVELDPGRRCGRVVIEYSLRRAAGHLLSGKLDPVRRHEHSRSFRECSRVRADLLLRGAVQDQGIRPAEQRIGWRRLGESVVVERRARAEWQSGSGDEPN